MTGVEASKLFVAPHGEWCSAHGQQTRHFRPLEKAFAYSPSAEEWCEESSNKKTQEEKPR
jgi:hypothetical protein